MAFNIAALWAMAAPNYINLAAERVVIPDLMAGAGGGAATDDDLRHFMVLNGLDELNIRDVCYGSIMIMLVQTQAINHSAAAAAGPINPAPNSLATAANLARFAPLARTMMIAALAAAAEGSMDGDIDWAESFLNVYGSFASEGRVKSILSIILAHGHLGGLCAIVTIGEIAALNMVLGYRFTRFSTPGLIGRALNTMPYDHVCQVMSVNDVTDYQNFSDCGIAAQIASYGLRQFCTGMVPANNPLAVPAPNTTIAQLTAIPNPPYHPTLIKQAYIILEENGTLPAKWYQGIKAMQGATMVDISFRNRVKRCKLIVDQNEANLGPVNAMTPVQIAAALAPPVNGITGW